MIMIYQTVSLISQTGAMKLSTASLGQNLPVGSLLRSIYNNFPEYHTSLDNKQFICFEKIAEAIDACETICFSLEKNYYWKATHTKCVPFLSNKGVYPTVHSLKHDMEWKKAMCWMLNFTDGSTDLLSIAKRSNVSIKLLFEQAVKLENAKLLLRLEEPEKV
jgi:aminopeptidase-like protein